MPPHPKRALSSATHRYTVEALKKSPMLVRDPAEADVILVNDYCYKLRWLAYVHAGGWLPSIQTEADEAEAGQTLIAVRAGSLFRTRLTRRMTARCSSRRAPVACLGRA